MNRFFIFISLIALHTLGFSEEQPAIPLPSDEGHQLVVNNRILAKVNDKTISVLDVMKKMDLFFARNFPQYVDSKMAKFQFYNANWRHTLAQIIETELILADAQGKDLKITDGDVRETMQERFGPNVMASLDRLGISYEEARKMIHQEIVVQRMTWFKINSKAIQNVNPKDIKKAYRDWCEKHPSMDEWKYQVISIRSAVNDSSSLIAKKAYDLLMEQSIELAALAGTLKEGQEDPTLNITVSQEYNVNEKSLSASHKNVLAQLTPGSYSKPIAQISRVDKAQVFRIFYLKEHNKIKVPPFDQLFVQLQNELIDAAIQKETDGYIAKLRERFGYNEKYFQETLPADFQPFALY